MEVKILTLLLLSVLAASAQHLSLKSAMYPPLLKNSAASSAPFAFILSRTNANATATSSADTTGGTLIVITLGYDSTTTPVVNDSKGNTYQNVGPAWSNGARNAMIFCCTNPIVGASHTFSNNVGRICAMVFSGPPAKAQTSNFVFSAFTTLAQPGSITPATTGQLFVTAVNGDPNNGSAAVITITSSPGFNQLDSIVYANPPNNCLRAAYRIKSDSDSSAENPSWNMNPISVTSSSQVTFRPQ